MTGYLGKNDYPRWVFKPVTWRCAVTHRIRNVVLAYDMDEPSFSHQEKLVPTIVLSGDLATAEAWARANRFDYRINTRRIVSPEEGELLSSRAER